MNTEDDELIVNKDKLDTLVIIARFLDTLQYRWGENDFCPADISLSKNGDALFATVKDGDGKIILHRWILDEFKDSKIY